MPDRKCISPHCKNDARKRSRKCYKCLSREYRANNPMRASYVTLKYNAKRRGKKFTISFEYFKQFCYETAYLAGRGRTSVSFSVDRIDENQGYVPGNLRVITKGENSARRNKKLVYDWEHPEYAYVVNY